MKKPLHRQLLDIPSLSKARFPPNYNPYPSPKTKTFQKNWRVIQTFAGFVFDEMSVPTMPKLWQKQDTVNTIVNAMNDIYCHKRDIDRPPTTKGSALKKRHVFALRTCLLPNLLLCLKTVMVFCLCAYYYPGQKNWDSHASQTYSLVQWNWFSDVTGWT